MARRNILALIFVIIFAHCTRDIPIEYRISAAWLAYPAEPPIIQEAAEAWNKATCLEMFRFAGYSNDRTFNLDDLQDGQLVIYPLWQKENADANKVSELDYTGYSIADILIKRSYIYASANYRWHFLYHHPEAEMYPREYYFKLLKSVVAHELGHQLLRPVFGHNSDEVGYSIMNPSPDSPYSAYLPTKLDVDQLCSIYNCPPAKECPTRPTF